MTNKGVAKHENDEPRRRPFPWYCAGCGKKEVYAAVIHHTAEVNYDGRLYAVEVPKLEAARCRSCGETVFDDCADEQISDALRGQLHLLGPTEIRGALRELGLTQRELASRLGVAEATMSRWCTGALIQSRAMDNLLRAYFIIPQVRALLTGVQQDPDLGASVAT